MGTDVGYLRELVPYWAEQFDWPAQEAALARFRTRVRDLGICFLHARVGASADPLPRLAGLVLAVREGATPAHRPGAHGADPADAFDVVVPDMPGFGHSDRPAGAPLDSTAVAGLWARLMSVHGYAQSGGDIASRSAVTSP